MRLDWIVNSLYCRKWQANTTGVSRVAAHSGKGHSLIATADTTVKVWDLASQKTLIKFSAEKITSLQYVYILETYFKRTMNTHNIQSIGLHLTVNTCWLLEVIE